MVKLYDSELKVMEILWKREEITAKEISVILSDTIGWNKNTTYTVIKKCVEKGAVSRSGTNFVCRPLISREEAQNYEVNELIGKMFSGKKNLLFASLLKSEDIPDEIMDELKKYIGE